MIDADDQYSEGDTVVGVYSPLCNKVYREDVMSIDWNKWIHDINITAIQRVSVR